MVLMHPGYPLADGGTANFVVGMKDCLSEQHAMNVNHTSAGGWDASELRTYLNNTIYVQLPEYIRNIFKQMNIWTANGDIQSSAVGVYSKDYLSLPAEKEIFGTTTYADESIELRLFQFDWYKTASNRVKQVNGVNEQWWERSPCRSYSDLFCCVDPAGSALRSSPSFTHGVSFFGCI